MLTLHGYFGRELLKTFAMTAVALTLLLVLGGGVHNLFKGEGLGAEKMVQVFAFLVPVAITLILPTAALFSAAITYGRASADNEITACRAAGINIHRLLLAAAALGLAVSAMTYWSWNFLIPGLSKRISDMTRRDIPTIVMSQFQRAKPLVFGKYRIMANRCDALDPEALPSEGSEDHSYLLLSGVTFLEIDDEEPARFGTADATIIDFDRSESTPKVTVDLQGVRTFDATRRQYFDLSHQILGPFDIPVPIKRKIKFENLPSLLRYRRNPMEGPEIEDRLFGLRRLLMEWMLYEEIALQLREDGFFTLRGPDLQYEVHVKEGGQDPHDGRPAMNVVRVVEQGVHGRVVYTADRATVELRSSYDRYRPVVILNLLDNVTQRRADPGETDSRQVHKPRDALKPVEFMDQPGLRARFDAVAPELLMDGGALSNLQPRYVEAYESFKGKVRSFRTDVLGEIHFRASYSLSAIAVVTMGAILGIIVRGGQVLTAFGISCLPSLIVVVSSIVGRNLSDRPDYIGVSLSVMWGSTIVMFAATAFVGFKVLRR